MLPAMAIATSGWCRRKGYHSGRWMTRYVAGPHAVTVAERGVPFNADISPTRSPETLIDNSTCRPSPMEAVTFATARHSNTRYEHRLPSRRIGVDDVVFTSVPSASTPALDAGESLLSKVP